MIPQYLRNLIEDALENDDLDALVNLVEAAASVKSQQPQDIPIRQGTATKRLRRVPFVQYENGRPIAAFFTHAKAAEVVGVTRQLITMALNQNNNHNMAAGYQWSRVDSIPEGVPVYE